MTTNVLIDKLAAVGVTVVADGTELVLTGRTRGLSTDLLAEVRFCKAAILEALRPDVREPVDDADRRVPAAVSPCGAVSVSLSASSVFIELAAERIMHADRMSDLPEVERAAVLELVRTGGLWQSGDVVLRLCMRWADELLQRSDAIRDPETAGRFRQAADVLASFQRGSELGSCPAPADPEELRDEVRRRHGAIEAVLAGISVPESTPITVDRMQ
jgi:hypothetical protein